MRSVRLLGLALGAALLLGASLARAKGDLDCVGKPKEYEVGKVQQYALWHDDDGWHLRVTTAKEHHHFKGRMVVKGGTFTDVKPIKAERGDRWKMGPEKHVFAFDFSTDEGEDGLDWHCTKDSDTIEFDLEIGPGNDKAATHKKADRIFVGAKGEHPDEVPFKLPAHPGHKGGKRR